MTVSDLLERTKTLLIVLVVVVVVGPLVTYILTPSVYYVAEDGALTVHAKGLDESFVLRCPQFNVSVTAMTLTGPYATCKTIIKGDLVYVLPRGLMAAGPVSIEVLCGDESESILVGVKSKDHPIVPLAFIHMARTKLTKKVSVDGEELVIDVVWNGAIDTSKPPLVSVLCNGVKMSQRHTGWGVL